MGPRGPRLSPDEAADLIADLRKDTVQAVFQELDSEYGATVRELLAHEEDEAGGLMTTLFIALPGPVAKLLLADAIVKFGRRRVRGIAGTRAIVAIDQFFLKDGWSGHYLHGLL